MSDIQAYLGNKIVRWLGGQAFPAAPASVYVALFNGDPAAGGTEVTSTIHTAGRVAASFGANVPAAGTVNNMSNDADTDFGTAAGAATINFLALFDAQSGGNLLMSHAVSSQAIAIGTSVKVNAASLTITIGNPGA
jgi:hypothetical protein